jgi:hypothetical protein
MNILADLVGEVDFRLTIDTPETPSETRAGVSFFRARLARWLDDLSPQKLFRTQSGCSGCSH